MKNKNKYLYTMLASSLLLAISTQSNAEITINGFASIRATSVDSDTGAAPYARYKGDGDISFKDESLFALQMSSDLGEGLSATVQLLAEGRNDFELEAAWAYLNYSINDTHTLTVGRFAHPLFNQSQYENVGYAHNYGRLPKAVYDDFDFNKIEGVTLDSTYFVGDYTIETKLLYGNWESGGAVEFKDEIGFNLSLSYDWWKVFGGYLVAEFDSAPLDAAILDPVIDTIIAAASVPVLAEDNVTVLVPAVSAAEAERFRNNSRSSGVDAAYWYVGFDVNYNNFLVSAEKAEYVAEESILEVNGGWFVSLGYRFNEHVVTLHHENLDDDTNDGFLDGITHPVLIQVGTAVNAGIANQRGDVNGITWRYDFHPSAALKVDYLKGEVLGAAPSGAAVGDFDLWSVGVDMVF